MVEQLPLFPPKSYNKKLKERVLTNVLELVYTSNDLKHFAEDLGFEGDPIEWDLNRREVLQAELYAIYAHLYHISRDDLTYILNSFKVLKKKEKKRLGYFKTKKLILEAFDKFSKKIELFEIMEERKR